MDPTLEQEHLEIIKARQKQVLAGESAIVAGDEVSAQVRSILEE